MNIRYKWKMIRDESKMICKNPLNPALFIWLRKKKLQTPPKKAKIKSDHGRTWRLV
jgi:hypothetical protein